MANYKGESIDLTPPQDVADAAARGLEFRREFGRGGTGVGVARARDLSNRKELSPSTIRRMVSYFSRHAVDKQADGFREGEPGYPSNGIIAWLLWGGDPGERWSTSKNETLNHIDNQKGFSGMENQSFKFEVKAITEDEKYFIFEGYASTFGNVDRGRDVVLKGAFTESISIRRANSSVIDGTSYASMLPVLWQHNMCEPVGTFIELREDDNGLYVKGALPKDDTFVSGRVIPQMRAKSISTMSIGYSVDDYDVVDGVRQLKKLTLWETSLVTMPMNTQAKITGMKAVVPFQGLPIGDRESAWDSAAAVERVREFTDSTEEPSDTYKMAFLWYDEEDDETFGAYKLPIADVVDGRLTAMPRAIFAAAAALSGARGGVSIPDEDRPGVIAVVEQYYEKMGLASPFSSKSFRIDDWSSVTERELEDLLRDGVSFSQKGAKKVISALKSASQRDVAEEQSRDAAASADVDSAQAAIDSFIASIKSLRGK